MGQLGVQISMEKSLESKTSFEFAKRFVQSGLELSGASLLSLCDRKFYLVLAGLRQIESRWSLETRITRANLKALFTALGHQDGLASRLATKAWRASLVPLRGDSEQVMRDKYWDLFQIITKQYPYLSCTSLTSLVRGPLNGQIFGWINAALSEVKVKMLEEGIVKTQKLYFKYITQIERGLIEK
jgi:hypothetical protein